jgi:hypothetical protein
MGRCVVVLAVIVWSRGVGSVHFWKAVARLQSNNSFFFRNKQVPFQTGNLTSVEPFYYRFFASISRYTTDFFKNNFMPVYETYETASVV